MTGHDFLAIGTGDIVSTNYPNTSITQYKPSNQVIQNYPGRVYYISTDQSGNFSVGQYFAVNQATGSATLNASSFNLSGLSSLRLGTIGAQLGAQINEFSTDGTLSQNSNQKVPTQAAVATYVTTAVSSLNYKANVASPQFTGIPTAPTANYLDNTTQIATTAYADNEYRKNILLTYINMSV